MPSEVSDALIAAIQKDPKVAKVFYRTAAAGLSKNPEANYKGPGFGRTPSEAITLVDGLNIARSRKVNFLEGRRQIRKSRERLPYATPHGR
jgi:hypothetical protein